MSRFIELPEEEKRNVFQAVSGALGLRSDIIEKDYWVCDTRILQKSYNLMSRARHK